MNFIDKYGNFFLFLLLEGIALYIVSQYNEEPNKIYRSSANLISGTLYEQFSTVRKYFSIQEIADNLAKENAKLKTQLEASKYVVNQQRGTVKFPLDTSTVRPDTAPTKDVMQLFTYQTAEVVKNSIVMQDNYLTINRGTNHGVKKGMGVISPDGIVGIITNVEPHYSQVLSILSKQSSISAMIKRNRFFGPMVWNGNDPTILTLKSIPKHGEVIKGDTIMTSGFSEIFPGELRIGQVSDSRIEKGSNFYTIDVKLWSDLSNIRYVYIVENKMITEFNNLEKFTLTKNKK